jgi:hypothetical protein
MSYEHNFKLKIIGAENVKAPFCPTCDVFKDGKFCSNCGDSLIKKSKVLNTDEIISELRTKSEFVDAALDGCGNGDEVENDIQDFSEKYPDIIFQLDITFVFGLLSWDSGFGDPPSRYYFKNGKKQDATPKQKFDSPNF